ncbi:MAG: RQC-minor-1 family DNA-binding protein [Candidatus Thermoplasmatota archaeon]
MSRRKVNRVQYRLNSKGIIELPTSEIKAILRGADDLIMKGGRNLLAKILKGSKEKKILELQLDKSPVYGFFKELTIEDILAKIDWLIENYYLEIEYDYRLPLLAFTKKGWEIEKDTYAYELLEKLRGMLDCEDYKFVIELKDRNRGMILLLLNKIQATGDKRFIPLLKAWAEIDYKKVRKAIRDVITVLSKEDSSRA